MSDSLLKANYIVVKNDEKRVIDTNQMVSDRIRILSEILEAKQLQTEEDITDGFVEGLDAMQVEQLLSDSDNPDMDGFVNGVAAPHVDVQRYIDEANVQANDIIAAANNEADQIIANANAESAAIRNNAMSEGRQEGYNAGYQEGLTQANVMKAELEQQSMLMQEDYERRISELEPAFVETLTDIYSHVLGVDLKGNTNVVMHLLKDAIRGIEGSRTFLVHVSKNDYQTVLERKEELLAGLGSNITFEVIEDFSLSESECYIEAESGIFDCGLGTELELLKKELILLSYRKEN